MSQDSFKSLIQHSKGGYDVTLLLCLTVKERERFLENMK